MPNPVLVEVTRGTLVESQHTGALAVARDDGTLLIAIGDVTSPVFPRSAIKPLQALAMLETGAADAFGFGAEEIALACASHGGTELHVAIARRMLEWSGVRGDELACGAHAPADEAAAAALLIKGQAPEALHNNCSGKHAGMLATAAHLGEALASYWKPDHPVQQRIERTLEELTDLKLGPKVRGIDGCSVPNWALPLTALARAYARFARGTGLGPTRRVAADRILEACMQAPELVAGEGRLCTRLMRAAPGLALVKTGAEGVYCAALPAEGLGIALKIDDGARRAAEVAVANALRTLLPAAAEAIQPMTSRTLSNWRGLEVGIVRPAFALSKALAVAAPAAVTEV